MKGPYSTVWIGQEPATFEAERTSERKRGREGGGGGGERERGREREREREGERAGESERKSVCALWSKRRLVN